MIRAWFETFFGYKFYRDFISIEKMEKFIQHASKVDTVYLGMCIIGGEVA